MQPTFDLNIITPQGIVYQGKAIHTLLPAEDGLVGILAHHAPYVTSTPGGWLKVREIENGREREKKVKIGPGFFSVANNQASFLTQSYQSES